MFFGSFSIVAWIAFWILIVLGCLLLLESHFLLILPFVSVFVLVCLNVFTFYDSFGLDNKSFFEELWAHFKESIGFYMIAFVCFALILLLGGCSKPTYKVQVKEVLIPIKCNLELPKKPKENGSFESHKALAVYYKEVEQIAKDCTKE